MRVAICYRDLSWRSHIVLQYFALCVASTESTHNPLFTRTFETMVSRLTNHVSDWKQLHTARAEEMTSCRARWHRWSTSMMHICISLAEHRLRPKLLEVIGCTVNRTVITAPNHVWIPILSALLTCLVFWFDCWTDVFKTVCSQCNWCTWKFLMTLSFHWIYKKMSFLAGTMPTR